MSTTDKDIRERASYWAARMHESSDALSAAEREEFEKFVADPRNERDFRGANLIISMMPELPAADRARWVEEYSVATDERTQSRRQVLRWWAVAASILTAVVLGGYFAQTRHLFGGEAYVTRKGETRTVKFEDDTVAYLNTQTEVRWLGTSDDRRAELTEGEALFDVAHDAEHPFRLMLGNSEIRVLGTRFNVYRKPNGNTTVTVLEGSVEVRGFGNGSTPEWTRTLNANDQIDYGALGLLHEPHPTRAQDAVRWRSGNYIFENQPVSMVLDELTRYTDQRIVIRDPRIADLRINGALNTRDVRKALRQLQTLDSKIEVKENNNTFTLDYRAQQPDRGKD
ncbi:MAG TPA: FecR domain-containing protein [Steroidobacteraceae bacterium]|jgi:transmembrane sensor|nr:FecR domain-containing protein [Steroidobacteraceae bacterium]